MLETTVTLVLEEKVFLQVAVGASSDGRCCLLLKTDAKCYKSYGKRFD